MKKVITILGFLIVNCHLIVAQKTYYVDETVIGSTVYDIQTTRSIQNRIYLFNDGTMGAVYNSGINAPSFPDLGIGYNYYDGNSWEPQSSLAIISGSAKNPSYSNYGENGEIVVSEGEYGLFINYRSLKGTGTWQETIFPGPSGCTYLYSPQIVTSGPDDNVIHVLALCKDTSQQLNYQDNIGKVLYSRSTDGGITWDPLHYYFDFNNDYFGFSELAISVAEPKNGTLAFVVGDYLTDLILMKSTDGGDSWLQTIIVDHPYPYLEFGTTVTDTFWTNTGSMDIALDNELKANVVFSLCHIKSEIENGWYYDSWSDGIVYWNEDMAAFSNNINALNPWGHPDSELIEDYNLVAWSQDINNNGELDFAPFTSDNPPMYPALGISSMPTLFISDLGVKFLIYSSLTETFDNGTENYRHIWARAYSGNYWGMFTDLTNSLIHIFDECVYPAVAPRNNYDYVHLIYQYDGEPGPSNFNNGGSIFPENSMMFLKFDTGIIPSPFALAYFSADTTHIKEGDTVQFINLSNGYPYNDLYYLWEFEGGTPASSSEKNPEVTYSEQGSYDVKLTAYVSPTIYDIWLAEDYITVVKDVGISGHVKEADFNLFPNPTKNILNVEVTSFEKMDYTISDLLGEAIFRGEIMPESPQLKLDLGEVNEGVYFITLSTPNKSVTKKLVVNK